LARAPARRRYRYEEGRGPQVPSPPSFSTLSIGGVRASRLAIAAVEAPRYPEAMGVRATVHNGRLIVDEPSPLPEGTVLELVIDDEQRRALNASISTSLQQAACGNTSPATAVLERLRVRRRR
ncbi:MAG: hypothetical protein KDK70_15895, partial [Myxococcales bacterium]|nr:hypothetical protein [Myxococcales bacterium]